MLCHPLDNATARALIKRIGNDGTVTVVGHAQKEMKKDDLNDQDLANVLRGGWVEHPEWENGEWRYRIRTARMAFVVEIPDEENLTVITGWREK